MAEKKTPKKNTKTSKTKETTIEKAVNVMEEVTPIVDVKESKTETEEVKEEVVIEEKKEEKIVTVNHSNDTQKSNVTKAKIQFSGYMWNGQVID